MKRAASEDDDGNKRQRGEFDSQDQSSYEFEEDDGENLYSKIDLDGLEIDELDSDQSHRWDRPPPRHIDSRTESLALQWLDIDLLSGSPWQNPEGRIVGSNQAVVPIIRLYGVTSEGSSVMVSVHGFTPYFYVSLPMSTDLSDSFLGALRVTLDQRIRDRARGDEKKLTSFVLSIERIRNHQSLLGYHADNTRDFIKVFMAMPSLVPAAKRAFDEGIVVQGYGSVGGQTYESNVVFILRFMIDNDISGASWVELPAGKYTIREPSQTVSRCSIEADITFNDLISHPCQGVWNVIAPLRILSFDIECQGRKGHFPEAQHDPVIQIANVVTLQGSDVPIIKNVFTLNTCLPIVGAQVISSETEVDMLLKWRDFVCRVDPDIITGYNIANFDIPYLLNRAKALQKQHPKLKIFADLGRVKGFQATMKDTTFQSSAYGKRENIETNIQGRVIFDILPYMYRNHKMTSYSLNSVSAEFLGQQKEDVHHSIISDLQMGTDADRHRLAVYCLKDALLPQQLMNKLAVLVNYVEMARVTGVPISFLLTRGQQIKVFSMILRKTRKINLLLPNIAKHGSGGEEEGYEGAFVIDPKRAYYETPIATLDFASLYPSIMQGYNLCYSTLLNPDDIQRLPKDSYLVSPSGHCFVKTEVKKGILPQILDELLAARKRAKKDMAAATDPMEKAVQNGRQLALKVSANSVYGFTGATVGQLPCVPIAASVTAYGRNLLLDTKNFVESTYTIANGYPYNAEVVYGDTDSVMVKFGYSTVEETMPLAQKAAQEVSAIFPRPIQLEFEKIYYPYLLMNKKRYAGLLWTKPEKYDKLDAKGLETVRRDNCLLVRRVVETCLKKILIERDVQSAIDYTKKTISDLLQNKLDISMLVITKSLGKSADDAGYAAKQAHVELAMRMKKRDPGTAPNVGDRVAYVIIQAAKGAPAYEKSEDPVYVLENGLPIDTEYYLTNQLANPITRIFEPIISNPQSLLSGDHTRVVCKPTPVAKAGGIMQFAVKKFKCMSCKTTSDKMDANSPLCPNCKGKEVEVYMRTLSEVNAHQQLYNQLWTECQHCQGSFHQDVICTNRDCPIFYKRKKVQIDLQSIQDSLNRFTW